MGEALKMNRCGWKALYPLAIFLGALFVAIAMTRNATTGAPSLVAPVVDEPRPMLASHPLLEPNQLSSFSSRGPEYPL